MISQSVGALVVKWLRSFISDQKANTIDVGVYVTYFCPVEILSGGKNLILNFILR